MNIFFRSNFILHYYFSRFVNLSEAYFGKFISEIQFYVIDQNELYNILKLPLEICKCILDYYPKCLKKN